MIEFPSCPQWHLERRTAENNWGTNTLSSAGFSQESQSYVAVIAEGLLISCGIIKSVVWFVKLCSTKCMWWWVSDDESPASDDESPASKLLKHTSVWRLTLKAFILLTWRQNICNVASGVEEVCKWSRTNCAALLKQTRIQFLSEFFSFFFWHIAYFFCLFLFLKSSYWGTSWWP